MTGRELLAKPVDRMSVSIDLLANNRQFPRLGLGGPPDFRERLMECMPPILIKVER